MTSSIFAQFDGDIYRVSIVKENKQDVIIGTSNAKLARIYKMDRVDKYYYEKWVPKKDVEIIEARKDIPLEK